MSRSALERQATRAARSGTLPAPTSAPAGFLSSVDDHLTEEQLLEEEVRSNVLPLHGNDRTFNLNTLLAQTILASEYFKGLAAITTYLEVSPGPLVSLVLHTWEDLGCVPSIDLERGRERERRALSRVFFGVGETGKIGSPCEEGRLVQHGRPYVRTGRKEGRQAEPLCCEQFSFVCCVFCVYAQPVRVCMPQSYVVYSSSSTLFHQYYVLLSFEWTEEPTPRESLSRVPGSH